MENASKALIIAGAILISILIIGLGVFIYQQAQSTVSKANLNSQEAQAQNQQFDNYFGDKVSAQEVKQLCTTVRSNNITGETGNDTKKVWLVYKPINGKCIKSSNYSRSNFNFNFNYRIGGIYISTSSINSK